MLSIVICSVNPESFDAVADNIRQTVGVAYEFIRIGNEQNKYSLAEAYILGVSIARGELICFIHEDVRFHTQDWGLIVQAVLARPEIGLLGIAGAYHYPLPPVGWFNAAEKEVHAILHFNQSGVEVKQLSLSKYPGQKLVEAVVVDGVFMVVPKRLFNTIAFDEKMLPGFHGYDVDISLQIGHVHKIVVTKEILLEHFSEGKQDKQWQQAMQAISHKWAKTLPRFIPLYSADEKRSADIAALAVYYRNRLNTGQGFFSMFAKTFQYATRQGITWQAVKIVLRTALKKK